MLPRSRRLTRERFKEIFAASKAQHTAHFLVRSIQNGLPVSRGAAVVSKKVERSSVGRHRLRRRMYAALEECSTVFPTPCDIIVVAKKGAEKTSFREMKAELCNTLAS